MFTTSFVVWRKRCPVATASVCEPSSKQRRVQHDDGAAAAAAAAPAGPAGPRRAAGELEAAALGVLHAAGTALTPGEVRDRLGGGLAYTTVVTILSRLHAKGVLTRLKSGRAYAYAPVADEPGLAARRMRRVLDAQADRDVVLARFVSELSAADEELLRSMLGGHSADG